MLKPLSPVTQMMSASQIKNLDSSAAMSVTGAQRSVFTAEMNAALDEAILDSGGLATGKLSISYDSSYL